MISNTLPLHPSPPHKLAYNHNLDTSREYYPKVITTRSYDERLDTISAVNNAGISVCSGGILGLGETDEDRVGLLWEVSK